MSAEHPIVVQARKCVGLVDESLKAMTDTITSQQEQIAQLREALSFAQSVIRSGEPWSRQCDEIIGTALTQQGAE